MKVSIGIPFYNPGNVFKQAIMSVLAQSFTDFELILLDDGSNDGSLDIAQSFDDNRIRVISDGHNLKLPTRLNQLIELSQGEYIARMDADDLIAPSRIAEQVKFLDSHPKTDLVATGLCSITDDYHVIGYRTPTKSGYTNIHLFDAISGKAGIAHATVMARSSWYKRNHYNEKAQLMEDYQLWIDAAVKQDLNIGFLPQPLYFYREQSSVSSQKAITAYKNQYQLVTQRYFNLLPLKHKLKFSLLTIIKIIVVTWLNWTNKTDKLMSLRNKSTPQNQQQLAQLQQQLDEIRK